MEVKNNNVDFLLSSFKVSASSWYHNECDLINKYNICNVSELPQFDSVVIICDNSSLDSYSSTEEVLMFQLVLLYYFLVLFLPNFYASNKTAFKIKVRDKTKIDYLLSYFYLESNNVFKKKIKSKKLACSNPSLKNSIMSIEVDFLTRGLILNKELAMVFRDVGVSSIEKLLVKINIRISNKTLNNMIGISSEKFFRNLMYLWSF